MICLLEGLGLPWPLINEWPLYILGYTGSVQVPGSKAYELPVPVELEAYGVTCTIPEALSRV